MNRFIYLGLAIICTLTSIIATVLYTDNVIFYYWSLIPLSLILIFKLSASQKHILTVILGSIVVVYGIQLCAGKAFHTAPIPTIGGMAGYTATLCIAAYAKIHYGRILRRLDEEKRCYQSLFTNNPDAVFFLDTTSKITSINNVAEQMLGFSSKELLHNSYESIMHVSEQTRVKSFFHELLQGQAQEYDTIALHKNGVPIDIRVKHIPMITDGFIVGTYAVIKDMTKLVRTKKELIETKNNLESFYNQLTHAINIIDLNYNVIRVNPAFETMYGWKQEELIGNPLPIIPEENMHLCKKMLNQVIAGKHVPPFETTGMRKDGTLIEINLTLSPIYDLNKNIVSISAITSDVTEKKRIEDALRKSEERYRLIAENMTDLIAVMNAEGIVEYASPSYKKVLGVEPEDYVGHLGVKYIVEEDKPYVLQQFFKNLSAKKPFKLEFRKFKEDTNEILDFETIEIPILDENGEVDKVIGISRDITARKKAEKALQENAQKYKIITENMNDLIIIMDAQGFVTYASPSYEKVLGITPEEYIGQRGRILIDEDDVSHVLENIMRARINREPFSVSYKKKNKAGKSLFYFETVGTPVLDEHGNLSSYICVSRNLTERHEYENKLAHMAYHDALTGLPNRRLFIETIEQARKKAERHERNLAVMYMDLDDFKRINDTLGHDTGDELLKQFAGRVKGCLRESDMLARLGGDEFCVLLETSQEEDIFTVANKILDVLQQSWKIGEHEFVTTSSIGIAIYQDGMDSETLIKKADTALYEAKASGRNKASIY